MKPRKVWTTSRSFRKVFRAPIIISENAPRHIGFAGSKIIKYQSGEADADGIAEISAK